MADGNQTLLIKLAIELSCSELIAHAKILAKEFKWKDEQFIDKSAIGLLFGAGYRLCIRNRDLVTAKKLCQDIIDHCITLEAQHEEEKCRQNPTSSES